MVLAAEIILTGGPCGGKSTSLERLQEKIRTWGMRPLVMPELATMFIGGGVQDISRLAKYRRQAYVEVEQAIILSQIALREHYLELARTAFADEKVVLLQDRGIGDAICYLERPEFDQILRRNRLSLLQLRDTSDAVIHLVSAAIGAERHYTTANNAARRETVQEARECDLQTRAGWVGHPHLRIVPNAGSFEQKLARVEAEVARVLGVPESLEIERKFLLRTPPPESLLRRLGAVPMPMEQTYLLSPKGQTRRVRRRGEGRDALFYYTRKGPAKDAVRRETEERISAHRYRQLLVEADPERIPLHKTRWYFIHQDQYFELDCLSRARGGELWLLELELLTPDQPVDLPKVLGPLQEVTGRHEYAMSELARR